MECVAFLGHLKGNSGSSLTPPPHVPYRDKALSMGPHSRSRPDYTHSGCRLGKPCNQIGSDHIFLLRSLPCMDIDLAASLGRKGW